MNNLMIATILATAVSISACSQEAEQKPADNDKKVVVGPVTSKEWFDAGAEAVAAAKAQPINANKAKNVILFVGDGMGIATLTAARILEGQLRGESGEENLLSFENFPNTAFVKTYTTDKQVPDSAGTASAFNTGVKTKSGVLGVGPEQPYGICKDSEKYFSKLFSERLEEQGFNTGIVTTTAVTHATPAAVYAHSASRGWQADSDLSEEAVEYGCKDIALQLIDYSAGDGIDIILGGGREHFLPKSNPEGKRSDGRDLTNEWASRKQGRRYISSAAELRTLSGESSDQVLGLFNKDHMSYSIERSDEEPSLVEMTEAAIDFLSNKDKRYFLMVEGGRIDHAHHSNNAYRALYDAVELSETIKRALEMVDINETMILVTADHDHTMTIAGYPDRGNPIFGLSKSDGKVRKAKDGKPFTTIGYYTGSSYMNGNRPDLSQKEVGDKDYKQQTAIPFSSESHSGIDVALFAIGPWSHLVRGTVEQNLIYHYMINALGLNEEKKAK